MNKKRIFKVLVILAKSVFCLLTAYLTLAYTLGLLAKIENPSFKNLPWSDYLILGLVVVGLLIIAFIWVFKPLIRIQSSKS